MRLWSLLLILLLAGCSGDLVGSSNTTGGGKGEVPSEQLRTLEGTEYRVTFKPNSDWGQGFTADIEVVNLTSVKVTNWKLEFDFPYTITSMWNGKVVSRTGNHYVVTGQSYNSWIEPNGSVSFGFQGAPGGVKSPTGFRLTGDTPGGTASGSTGSTTGATTSGPTGGTTGGTTTGTTSGTSGTTTGGSTGTTGGSSGGTTGGVVTWHTDDDWGAGFVGTVTVKNNGSTTLTDWVVEVQFGGSITNSWNTRPVSRNGNRIRFGAVDYNRSIPPGASVTFGFQASPGGVANLPVSLVSGGTTGTTTGGTGSTTGSTTAGTTGGSGSTTGSTTGGTTGGSGSTTGSTTGGSGSTTGSATGGPVVGTGYFHTSGSRIVDEKGNTVRLTGVNWFGLETNDFAPHGLWARSLDSMMAQIASEGYNCLRLPFSNQLFDAGSKPTTINFSLNPDLQGKTGLEIMDRIIERAQFHGIKVILDRHRPTGTDQSALWYTAQISEERWISDFEMLARRYQSNSTVIGFDLHNEPHSPATWGDGNLQTDWRLAAQRAGNRILAINPKLLILVEGVETAGGRSYWWGGNLKQAGAFPVVLNVPNQLVYSTHDYPSTVHPQTWFDQPGYPNNLPALWDECWGYLVKQNIAPVLVGEFGTRNITTSDQQWLNTLTAYLQTNGISFTYWSWNPNSLDTGGLLQDDWMTVIASKKAVLASLLAPMLK